MKRRDLIKLLEKNGWKFIRHGGKHDIYANRSVRRNITLPSWLNELAEKSGINVSGVTQRALKAELKVG